MGIDHPLGRNFYLSPTFFYFEKQPHILRSIKHLHTKNTPALKAMVCQNVVSSNVIGHNTNIPEIIQVFMVFLV